MTETDKGQKDNLKEMAYIKAQKLAGATYLISDFLNDSDPVKWRLREQSLIVMTLINPINLESSLGGINRMISYLDIVLASSQVSTMNLSILKQEYQALGQLLLKEKSKTILEQLPDSTPRLELEKEKVAPIESKRQIESENARLVIVPTSQKDNTRRSQILSFIKNRGESSIKDISKAVPHVSSKTVQRELSDLVKSGLLQREGDRRWSRYRLTA
jgi:hypothetical protein